MSYNLFIAYDLITPGQDYEAVHTRIKQLGKFSQLQFSLFYVHTEMTPAQAYQFVRGAMDANDRLIVINAFGGVVSSPQWVIEAINGVWFTEAA